ncbi:DUF916 domain-containing protein [Enterococcus dongliensis]|nr:DUF916 domain-containing protein [Enterococcus dongliensis]
MTPLTLDQRAISGQKIPISATDKQHRLTVTLTNFGELPMKLSITGVSAVTNEAGKLFYQKAKKTAFGKVPFLAEEAVIPQQVTLAANESKVIQIDLLLPKINFTGEVMGAIAVSESDEATYLPIIFQGNATAAKPVQLVKLTGALLSEMPALSIELGNSTAKLLPVDIDLTLTNSRFFGLRKATYHLQQNGRFAPNQVMASHISLQGKPLIAGKYHITGTIRVENKQQIIDQYLTLAGTTADKINDQATVLYHDPFGWLLLAAFILVVLIGITLNHIKHQKKNGGEKMKKIFASLTVSGLVLLTVASGGTALAATENGFGTPENNISKGTAGEGFVADDTKDATAKSTAEFTVEPGFLTLDEVPDLKFETTAAGTLKTAKTLKLSGFDVTNPGTSKNKTAFDGNSNGNVIVSDFVGATPIAWQLSASLGEFTGLKGEAELNLALAGKQTAVTTTDYAVVADNGTVTATDNVYTLAVDKDSTTLTLEKGSVLKTGTYQADLNWQLTNSVTPSAAE